MLLNQKKKKIRENLFSSKCLTKSDTDILYADL